MVCTHSGNNATCSQEGTPLLATPGSSGIVCTGGGMTGSVLVTFASITATPFCADRAQPLIIPRVNPIAVLPVKGIPTH